MRRETSPRLDPTGLFFQSLMQKALRQRVERMSVVRLEALIELARRRGTDVKTGRPQIPEGLIGGEIGVHVPSTS